MAETPLYCEHANNGCHKVGEHKHGKSCDRSCYICRGSADHEHKAVEHDDRLAPWCDWCGLTANYQQPRELEGHIHHAVKHQDGLPPWCNVCGLTENYGEPSTLMSEKIPDGKVEENNSFRIERKIRIYLPSADGSPDLYVGRTWVAVIDDRIAVLNKTPLAEFIWNGTLSKYPVVYKTQRTVPPQTVPDHIHRPSQHGDGLPAWCNACGLTVGYRAPHEVMGLSVKPVIQLGRKIPVYLPSFDEDGKDVLIGDLFGEDKNQRVLIKTNTPFARAMRNGLMTGRDIISRPVSIFEGEQEMASNDRMGNVIIEGARIGFRNFSGKEGQYNREGDRNFAVFLDQDIAEQMKADGWNVKQLRPREEGDAPQDYIQVAVSYKGRPPRITMLTSRGKTPLGEDQVDILDWASISNVDVIIRPYEWAVSGKTGVKAYLQTIYVTLEEDELEQKYADVPDSAQNSIAGPANRLALEAGDVVLEDLGER